MKIINLILIACLFFGCGGINKFYVFPDNLESVYDSAFNYIAENPDQLDNDLFEIGTQIVVYPELVTFDPFSFFYGEINQNEDLRVSIKSSGNIDMNDLHDLNSLLIAEQKNQQEFKSSLTEEFVENPSSILFFSRPYKNLLFVMIQPYDPVSESFSEYSIQGVSIIIMLEFKDEQVSNISVVPFQFGV